MFRTFTLRRPAGGVCLLLCAVQPFGFALAFTLGLVYQVRVAQLGPLQLVLVGTALELTCFLAEIPTGVVADLWSRRTSVVIGVVLVGVGIGTTGAVAQFGTIVLGTVVLGIGWTFISGAAEAWIADEVGAARVQPLFTRGEQVALLGTFVGTLAAGALGMIGLRWPLLAAGLVFVLLGLLLAVVMPQDGFARVVPSEGGRGRPWAARCAPGWPRPGDRGWCAPSWSSHC